MKLAIGCDHRGAALARQLIDSFRAQGHDVDVFGDTTGEPADYPDAARDAAHAVGGGQAERGVLICGSGIGMSIAANKVAGARAALVHDELSARMSRNHNDANIICLSADLISGEDAERIVEAFFAAEFEGGRHQRRVDKINALDA